MSFRKKIFFYLLIILFNFNFVNSIENKILLKINNEIITTIDLYNETNYLIALNNGFKSLKKEEIFEITKNSLIKEKILANEILKYTNNLKLEERYLEQYLEALYKKQNLTNLDSFIDYLKDYNVSIDYVKKKISIEIIWNDLIVAKFSNDIKINYDKIKSELKNNYNNKSKQYLLSEIIYNSSLNSNIEEKTLQIQNDIKDKGFKNAVLIHSISDTSLKNDGEIGWVDENSLNLKIKNILNNLSIGDHTLPITVPGGFLILKINDIKIVENKDFDIDKKMEEIVRLKRNEQFNNYSNIYYNKILKEFIINEEL